jgi:hypothetical protein
VSRVRAIDASPIYPAPTRRALLWQGSKPPTGRACADAGFEVLVLCAEERQGGGYEGVVVYYVDLDDGELTHDEWTRARAMAHLVAAGVRGGARTVVTCNEGRNRSGLVVACALHLLAGRPGAECVAAVRRARLGALTNASFVRALGGLR